MSVDIIKEQQVKLNQAKLYGECKKLKQTVENVELNRYQCVQKWQQKCSKLELEKSLLRNELNHSLTYNETLARYLSLPDGGQTWHPCKIPKESILRVI